MQLFLASSTQPPHRDVYRLSRALVEQFITGYATPPKALVLDLDHSEDKAHGQQPLAFYNGYYRSTCYLPLFIFEPKSGDQVVFAVRCRRDSGGESQLNPVTSVVMCSHT